MGGYVAFEFVRRYPEMLCGLILVGTQPAADSDAAKQARYETADFVRREGTSALAERLIPRFLGKTTLATKQPVVEKSSEVDSNRACPKLSLKLVTVWLRVGIRDLLLAEIKLPTLIVAGSEDAAGSFSTS